MYDGLLKLFPLVSTEIQIPKLMLVKQVCVFVDTQTQTHRHIVKDLILSTQGVLLEASHGDTADCVTVKVISHSTVWVQKKICRSMQKPVQK